MVVGSPTKLNLIPSGVMPVVYINQGDAGYDKEFLIYNGDSPYNVPAGVSATIRGKKADGYGVTEAAALTTGSNLVTVTITEQMVAAAGANLYELVFVDTDGLRIATINMVWAVKADALGDTVISDSDLDYATTVMNTLQSVQAFKNQLDTNTDGLAAETAARIAADDAERTARIAADNTLQANINAEASTRIAQDAVLQAEINQLVAPSGSAPSAAEVQNARIGVDGTVYDTLGNAIRGQVTDLKSALNDVESYLGYPRNYFDGRGLTTTNPTNWTISATKTSVSITHNNSFTGGTPTLALNVPVGEYIFHATYSTAEAFYLYIDGVYSSAIKDGSSLVIESGKTYMFEALNISSGVTQTITDISITSVNTSGIVQILESDIDAIESAVNEISETVTRTLSVEMESDTASTVATANGVESAASTYHTVKFPVKGSDVAHVSVASTNWGNPYYIICNSNNEVVAVSESSPSSSTVSALNDFVVNIPTNGSYLIVNYLPSHSFTPTASVTREVLAPKGVFYPFVGKKWVAIGDSLTEKNESASINYVDLICSNLGLSCVNMGVGGTGYMRGYDTNKAFYQRVVDIPSDVDIITIFGSGNDLGLYNQIGTPSDSGTSTICGCINTTLDYIANNFPTVPVVVIAPTIWKDQIPTSNTPMTYYVQFLEEIAKRRSLHFLNMYTGGGLNPNNAAQLAALFYDQDLDGNGDGVHPNNAGHRIIAPKIKNAIESALIAD